MSPESAPPFRWPPLVVHLPQRRANPAQGNPGAGACQARSSRPNEAGGSQVTEDSGYRPSLMRRRRGNALTHMLTAVIAAGIALGLLLAFDNPASGEPGSLPGGDAVPSPAGSPAPLTGSEQAVVTKVKPGVVIINTTLHYNSEAAAGTGMVINANGLVLTNNHVINGSTKIRATVASTGTTYTATVVGYDKTGDIALIQLQNASGLTTVPIGNSSSVKAGTAV